MSQENSVKFFRFANPILWGVVATGVIIFLGVATAQLTVCETTIFGIEDCERTKWLHFLEAAPNEVGDTLAGFAGALAFVWLIATVWLQGQELAAQRQELREQRLATQDMAQAQGEQVKLLKLQGNIFQDEQRQRLEDRNDALLQRKLEYLKAYIIRRCKEKYFVSWVFDLLGLFKIFEDPGRMPILDREKAKSFIDEHQGPDSFFPTLHERVRKVRKEYGRPLNATKPEEEIFHLAHDLINRFEEIVEMRELISPPAQVRVDTLLIMETKNELIEFVELFNSFPDEETPSSEESQ